MTDCDTDVRFSPRRALVLWLAASGILWLIAALVFEL
jgi:hypothetical protein